jgi:hypothetical protein
MNKSAVLGDILLNRASFLSMQYQSKKNAAHQQTAHRKSGLKIVGRCALSWFCGFLRK